MYIYILFYKIVTDGPYLKHLKKRFECDELFESPLYDQLFNGPEKCKSRSDNSNEA